MVHETNRREFLKTGGAALAATTLAASARSYAAIRGANERVRVGVVGCGDRMKGSLIPAFLEHNKELNFEFAAISDLWSLRREQGIAYIDKLGGGKVDAVRNNDELYARKDIDAVLIATADFQHALHGVEAVDAGRDAYVEKPIANTMAHARKFRDAVKKTGRVVAVGTQRRSTPAYQKAADYIKSGAFGDIVMVEMSWNVNQPGRWRRPDVVPLLKEQDTDWTRFLQDKPKVAFDARKYLEFRLFWPYSSGIPDQWLVHQIDTVHWFTGLPHPRSCVANGGIYLWKDGRQNWDTMTAVFDYGPVTPTGGLSAREAAAMGMKENKLPSKSLVEKAEGAANEANTGRDPMTSANVRNWMECVRSRQTPNASAEAGYSHSIALCMNVAAIQTGQKITFNDKTQQVLAGGKVYENA